MELGFLFVWGMMGSKALLKRPEGVLLASMMAASLLAMAFVTEALEGNVFLRKGLYLLTLPLFLAAGHYLYSATLKRGMAVMLAFALLAFPTVVTDIYALIDTNDETFKHTYLGRRWPPPRNGCGRIRLMMPLSSHGSITRTSIIHLPSVSEKEGGPRALEDSA
jgi:hypothetical protein